MSGAFWGMLFGIIFFVPIFGLVVGAAMGSLTGSMADVGINDDFIKSVRSKVTEGTSALFLLTTDAVKDKVFEAMKQFKFELIASNLSKEEENKLRTAFAEEQTQSINQVPPESYLSGTHISFSESIIRQGNCEF